MICDNVYICYLEVPLYHRYGPCTANIHGKLFKHSKTELFYYGGKSYTSGGTTGSRGSRNSETGDHGQDQRLFAPGVQASVAEVSQEMRERRSEVTPPSLRAGQRVTTAEGGDIL